MSVKQVLVVAAAITALAAAEGRDPTSQAQIEPAFEKAPHELTAQPSARAPAATLPRALAKLLDWFRAHVQWRRAARPRAPGYNSPFSLFRQEHSEVRIPVKPAGSDTDRPVPPLNDEEKRIIIGRGTERPFSGKYWDHFEPGLYACRQCGTALYSSKSKFRSECGWPSFDDEIPGAVRRRPDPDGLRTEITCTACGGHLGHVFKGERITPKNVRHCVNSASLTFRPPGQHSPEKSGREEAIFAGGCFWGVEHHLEQVDGVIGVTSGYTGGRVANPTYEQVCTGKTHHAEAVRVVFDPRRVTYERVARVFFEIHDPAQLNRQGPDVGTQYRSAVFYADRGQKETAEKLIAELRANGYEVVTELLPASEFFPAEDYHQNYLATHPARPTCHIRTPRFDVPAKR